MTALAERPRARPRQVQEDSGLEAISFTATRRMTPRHFAVTVEPVLAKLHGAKEYTTGGAPGGDQLIAKYFIVMDPDAVHRIVLPVLNEKTKPHHDFAAALLAAAKAGTHKGWKIEVVKSGLLPLDRNEVILRYGEKLVGFPWLPEDRDLRSGTWATIRRARKRQMPIDFTVLNP